MARTRAKRMALFTATNRKNFCENTMSKNKTNSPKTLMINYFHLFFVTNRQTTPQEMGDRRLFPIRENKVQSREDDAPNSRTN